MPTKSNPYRVPTLAETNAAYAELLAKRAELQAQQIEARKERRTLQQQIDDAPEPAHRPGVARLLGEQSDSITGLRARVKELTSLDSDITAALEVIRQRLVVARTAASRDVCALVRPEYGKRVSALCDAFRAVVAARAEYDELRDQLEMEDVAWSSLVPLVPTFLGDARDGNVQRFLKEAKEAGYND